MDITWKTTICARGLLAVLTVLFALAPRHVAAQGRETIDPKDTLKALRGVAVRVDISETLEARGLRPTDLRTTTIRQLQKAGIEVYESATKAPSGAAPIVVIEVVGYKNKDLFSYYSDLKLYQRIEIADGRPAMANTYSTGNYVGMVGAQNLQSLAKETRRQIKQWRVAHRKAGQR